MQNNNITENFLDLAIDRKMYSTKSNLKFHLKYIFDDVELANKKVLDVGGGTGLLSFYAAVKGASKVVCLEPESDGSSSGMINKFNAFKTELSPTLPVELSPVTLQSYTPQVKDEEFDVVVMHSSINHLDEEACINFRKDTKSYNTYKKIMTDVYNKMSKGGSLIVADASCKNFYNAIGIKSIFAPTIEWHKHQEPSTWIAMLQEIGFKNPQVAWRSPNTFGKVGKVFMGNSFVSYLTSSCFKFKMEK
ncbi:class I SAM-dependent methyltransferase [Pontibacter ruber]|uniref:Class I SAM-dependent methyltransferase n=1 Tax=Pontibacter ruber TaxID=1343895 RepID=A0ABW5D001_9BACT|nr:class I SAM-dependent methyltransferase [Pontibacter ruber]